MADEFITPEAMAILRNRKETELALGEKMAAEGNHESAFHYYLMAHVNEAIGMAIFRRGLNLPIASLYSSIYNSACKMLVEAAKNMQQHGLGDPDYASIGESLGKDMAEFADKAKHTGHIEIARG